MKRQILTIILTWCIVGLALAQRVSITTEKNASERMGYAATYLQRKLPLYGYSISTGKGDFIISLRQHNDTTGRKKEGFTLTRKGRHLLVTGNDGSGVIYGCTEIANQLQSGRKLTDIQNLNDAPEMMLRGTCIGLQKTTYLPGHQVYEYPYTPENCPWFYDKKQWIRYLDMMVDNRMNSLYLWNGHPFASLVRLKDYPFAVEVDSATFKKNEEIFSFLTHEADRRGIYVIQMFYNIIVSKPFAGHYGIKTQDRHRPITPLLSDYTRKSVAAFVEKYPNVGLLVCLGEAMDTYDDDVEWFTKTILPGVKDGLKALGKENDPEPPIILRAHDTDCEAVMKAALPIYKNLYTMHKYNGESLTTYEPQGPWSQMHRDLASLGTHIENVHILANLEPWRWGSPRFVENAVQAMHEVHHANGLHLYPQASYWDWPYTADKPLTLISTSTVRVEPFGVHIWNNAACDSLFIDTEVKNYDNRPHAIQLVSKLNDSDGKAVFRLPVDTVLAPGSSIVIHQQTALSHPHRWGLADPYLYALASLVKEKGATTDAVTTPYGIRSISWPVHRKDGTGYFLLNGKKVFINGTCDYEHLFGASHAFTHEEIASRVKMMREAGFNAFREAHQPHNLYWQQLFDEQGMLFWSQFSAHIWYDTPLFRNNFRQLMRQWVKERRNSPSVILWGLQNESTLPRGFAQECSDIIREMDPTCRDQRAITTCNGGEGTDWNVVQNWSGTYGGNPDHYARELKDTSQLLNGEYGAWRTLGLHYTEAQRPAKKDYSEEGAARLLLKKALLAHQVRDSVCGHFQWLFVSHDNPGRVQPDEALRRIDKVGPFNYKGLLSPWEQPTEAFFAYKKAFGKAAQLDKHLPSPADRNQMLLKPAEDWHYLYRVNCGGDAYTDTYGQRWAQDDTLYSHSWAQRFGLTPFLASQGHIGDPIRGTSNDELFQRFRWGRHELYYHFPLPDGLYRVELYFAEPWLGKDTLSTADHEGERLFDVAINDSTVLRDVDLWMEGGYAGAVKKIVNMPIRGGKLTLSFPRVKAGEAVIAAIAIATREKVTVPILKGQLPDNYWQRLDNDTISRYPKSLLPKDDVTFPAIRYRETKAHQWAVKPGVAREYALHFRYKNPQSKAVIAHMTITDSQGITPCASPTIPPTQIFLTPATRWGSM